MILRSGSVRTVIISCRAIIIVTQFVALLITCSALASASLDPQDHHEGTGQLVGMHSNFLAVEHSASRTQYQSDSSVEINGKEPASYRSTSTRLRGMKWTLADGKLTSEERRTAKKTVDTRAPGVKGHVVRKNGVVKAGAALSSLASESKNLRPSSGIQNTLSSLQESNVISKEKMDGFAFQELEITMKRSLKSTASNSGDAEEKEETSVEPNTYKPAPPSATSRRKGQAYPTPQSQTFHVSESTSYESNDASDLSDIGMDYDRARRRSPIHNKAAAP